MNAKAKLLTTVRLPAKVVEIRRCCPPSAVVALLGMRGWRPLELPVRLEDLGALTALVFDGAVHAEILMVTGTVEDRVGEEKSAAAEIARLRGALAEAAAIAHSHGLWGLESRIYGALSAPDLPAAADPDIGTGGVADMLAVYAPPKGRP